MDVLPKQPRKKAHGTDMDSEQEGLKGHPFPSHLEVGAIDISFKEPHLPIGVRALNILKAVDTDVNSRK